MWQLGFSNFTRMHFIYFQFTFHIAEKTEAYCLVWERTLINSRRCKTVANRLLSLLESLESKLLAPVMEADKIVFSDSNILNTEISVKRIHIFLCFKSLWVILTDYSSSSKKMTNINCIKDTFSWKMHFHKGMLYWWLSGYNISSIVLGKKKVITTFSFVLFTIFRLKNVSFYN